MILPIYRSCVSVVQRTNGDIPALWHVCRFDPIAPRCKTSSGIWYVETDGCSRPTIHVKTPPLCKMVEQKGKPRLATPYDSYGHDAASVYYLAMRAERGFSVTTAPTVQVASTSPEIIDQAEPVAELLPPSTSIVVEVWSSFHVDPDAKSFVAVAPENRFNTTWLASEVRTWPSVAAAERWLEASVVGNDTPLTVGKNWIQARVVEIDLDTLRVNPRPSWLCGIRWCYQYPTDATPGVLEPDWVVTPKHLQERAATELPPRGRRLAPQPMFAFAD